MKSAVNMNWYPFGNCCESVMNSETNCRVKKNPLSDIMDLRHQSSAMCIIMLGGEDTHP